MVRKGNCALGTRYRSKIGAIRPKFSYRSERGLEVNYLLGRSVSSVHLTSFDRLRLRIFSDIRTEVGTSFLSLSPQPLEDFIVLFFVAGSWATREPGLGALFVHVWVVV